jgi:hypothetical protein
MAKHTKTAVWLLAILLLVIFFFGTGLTSKSRAQTPEPKFLVTWRARSYVPSQYKGKTLPTLGSQITVAFDAINQGKVVDLSKRTIKWYLGENILGSGKGMQTITVLAPFDNYGTMSLTIELSSCTDYDCKNKLLPDSMIIKSLDIPIVEPEAVIEAPFPGGVFSSYLPQVKGIPYFFNISSPSQLTFTWNVNGETPQNAEDPSNLTISLNQDVQPGSTVDVGLTLRNPNNVLTFAEAESTLIAGK